MSEYSLTFHHRSRTRVTGPAAPFTGMSVVVGVSLTLRSLESKAWAITVASAALVYGAIGVFALGVGIDMVLLAGAIVLSVLALRRTVSASPSTFLRDSLSQRG